MIFSWIKKANNFSKNYPEIIARLEKGDVQIIEQLLWQPEKKKVEYLPIVYDLILKFKKTDYSAHRITIHKTYDRGKYQLIIFNVPWLDSATKYSPLIFDRSVSKIVGIILPFNELAEQITKKESSDISNLSIEWTQFIIKAQFGI